MDSNNKINSTKRHGSGVLFLGIMIIILIIFVLCMVLTRYSSNTSDIYSVLEKNNYKIFYQFSYRGNYYDLERNTYNSLYEESDFIREIVDENTVASIVIVNMDTIDTIYKKEYFAYVPASSLETKYIYDAYVDDTGYMYRWSTNPNKSYISGNKCTYYINNPNDSDGCTDEKIKQAKEFYNNNYLFTLNKLNITEEVLIKLVDDITSNYIEPHKKELIKNDKGITYKEFLTNIENSSFYTISKTTDAVVIAEKKLSSDDTAMYNMYVTFEENKVDVLFLEYWEKVYIIYDNTKDEYNMYFFLCKVF